MRKISFLLLSFSLFTIHLMSQDLSNPGTYMDAMGNAHKEMDQKYMAYTSACSHGKRARKVEKLRLQVLENITNTKSKILELPLYKGDNSLRQSNVDYINVCYTIFNEDYSKIVKVVQWFHRSLRCTESCLSLTNTFRKRFKPKTDTFGG